MTQLPAAMSRVGSAGMMGDTASSQGSAESERREVLDELATELYTLLKKYILLQEATGNGWSVADEQYVDRIIGALVRAGWTITRTGHGELGGVPGAVIGAAKSNYRDEGESDGFQWTRDSTPDALRP